MRLVGAPTPSPEGKRKDRNEGDPLAQSSKQGTISCVLQCPHNVLMARYPRKTPLRPGLNHGLYRAPIPSITMRLVK